MVITKPKITLPFLICLFLTMSIIVGCGGSSGDNPGDEDSDGIDITLNQEENVAEITKAEDEYTINTSINDGSIIIEDSIDVINDSEVNQTSKPDSFVFPDDLISFTIGNLDPSGGETITVTLQFPTTYPPGAKYFKVSENGFEEYSNASIDGNTVTLTLTDGGDGDSDNVAGQITDPGGPAMEGYKENLFEGSWLIDFGDGAIYFIGNNQGEIIEHSGIVSIFVGETPSILGTYNIESEGDFEIVINGDEGPFTILGKMISETQGAGNGEQNGYKIIKIEDTSICQGTWSGTLIPFAFGEKQIEISFSVDASGRISHVSGEYSILSGRMYSQDNFTVFKILTDDSEGPYNQISLTDGNLSGNQVNGTYDIDAEGNPAGDLLLFRQ
jgi:hypothetical protein